MADVFEQIRKIVVDLLIVDESEVTVKSTLTDLGADSLDVFEFAAVLEQEFGLTVTDEDIGQIRTVGDVVRLVQEHVKGRAG